MLSRRGFLAGTAAGAVSMHGAIAGAASPDTLDTAIVGGGPSGLYAAYRLIHAGHAAHQVGVFELSDRLGGRTFSVRMPGAEGMVAEFGGMRYLTNQKLVTSLIAQLDLPNRGFPMGGPDNFVYVRGKRFKIGDYAKKAPIPYDLAPNERGLDPFELMVKAIDHVIPGAEKLSPAQWQTIKRTATLDGKPLHAWGFRNVLNRFLSQEAMALIRQAGGYYTLPTNWSAAEALPFMLADFANHPSYRTLNDGMQSLTLNLSKQVEAKGATVNRQHGLVSLRVPAQTGTPYHELIFSTPSGTRTIRAKRVILGLPRRSLELVPDIAVLRDPETAALLRTVTPRPLCKAFLIHPEPYWTQFGLTSGDAATDVPARQLYYFGTEPERGPGNHGYATMAYFDGPAIDFWDGLRQLEKPGARGFTRLDPNGPFAREMLRQIVLVHGLSATPKVLSAGYMNWGDDPFGGGWHSWNQGTESWKIMDRVQTPHPGIDLHIVGDAWSTSQGWVEGALQTTENMLVHHMKLPVPNWQAK